MTSYQGNGANVAASVLSIANKLASTTGGTETSAQTPITANTTGWIIIRSQATGTSQSGAGSEPTISDSNMFGWFQDDATFDGQTMASGNYSPVVKLTAQGGSFTADLHCVIVKRPNGGGAYTVIGDIALTGQTIPQATPTTYTFPVTSESSVSFATGDRFGYVFIMNITVSSTGTGVLVYQSTSASNGVSSDAQLGTPGFSPSGCITASPASLFFNPPFTPFSLPVQVTSCLPSGSENWSVSALGGSSWLSVSPSSGSLGASQSQQVAVSVNGINMRPGEYNDTLQFVSGASTVNIPVKFNSPSIIGPIAPGGLGYGEVVWQGFGISIGTG